MTTKPNTSRYVPILGAQLRINIRMTRIECETQHNISLILSFDANQETNLETNAYPSHECIVCPSNSNVAVARFSLPTAPCKFDMPVYSYD